MSDVLKTAREAGVVQITLNRPRARNAMNVELILALRAAVDDAQDAGCIVITGSDPAFCAGLDLRDLGAERLADAPSFSEPLRRSATPLIAAVNGAAVAGGLELALGCDFIIASDRAAFADPHLALGVYPGPVLVDLPRRVGMAWAREISLTGKFIDAETALRIGLANHLVRHDDLLDFALREARTIAKQDRSLVTTMRQDWDDNMGRPIDAARDVHNAYIQRGQFRQVGAKALASQRSALPDLRSPTSD